MLVEGGARNTIVERAALDAQIAAAEEMGDSRLALRLKTRKFGRCSSPRAPDKPAGYGTGQERRADQGKYTALQLARAARLSASAAAR
jgi:hypothetical protein